MTGDETRGEAEVEALTSALGDIRVENARQADWWTSDEEHALLIQVLRGECRVWAEGLLRSDWLARRDAERDRARDAEARRVVEGIARAIEAASLEVVQTVGRERGSRVAGLEHAALIVRAALAEIEEGSP